MNKNIILFTGSNDRTADYITEKFQDIRILRINTDKFHEYCFSINNDGIKITQPSKSISITKYDSIYYRKPALPTLHFSNDEHTQFAYKEIFSLIDGICESHEGICITKPSILRRSGNKILQLSLAKSFKFNIPDSLITNYINDAQIKEKQLIVKPLASGEILSKEGKEFVQTNIMNKDIALDALKYCPTYFQEYINKDYDVRITIAGTTCHSIKILSTNNIDWRKLDAKNKYLIIDPPKQVVQSCLAMLEHFNLQFGCFDFVVKNNTYFFLELNPNGQWAWLEFETNAPIAKSIIKLLLGSC